MPERLSETGIHLERLATTGGDGYLVKPHCYPEAFEFVAKFSRYLASIDARVAHEGVVLARVERPNRPMNSIRKPSLWLGVGNGTRCGPKLAIQISDNLPVVRLRLAVVVADTGVAEHDALGRRHQATCRLLVLWVGGE